MLNCLGLPCYTSQGAHQDLLQVETVRNQPFVTLKSTFFPSCFPLEKIVLIIPAKHSFLYPSGEFQNPAFNADGREEKESGFLIMSWLKSTKNELLKHRWLWDIPCSQRLEGCNWSGTADKETCSVSGKAGIDQEQVKVDFHDEMGQSTARHWRRSQEKKKPKQANKTNTPKKTQTGSSP